MDTIPISTRKSADATKYITPLTVTMYQCRTADKLQAANVRFVIEPHVRFKGQVGERATMFFLDPAGNALEFKAFANVSQLFAR